MHILFRLLLRFICLFRHSEFYGFALADIKTVCLNNPKLSQQTVKRHNPEDLHFCADHAGERAGLGQVH
jgi:hypothetical protein